MQKRFAQVLNDMRGLINNGSAPVLLAVSGGVDSICMAELFASMDEPIPFAVAHCNFCLRAEESDGDEQLVREWAQKHGVRFHNISFDTREYAQSLGVSIEMAARDLRYGWFADLCKEFGYGAVAVAHNANDNAETLLLNVVRGTGVKGLTGMSEVSQLPVSHSDKESVALIRPLLRFTRKQIEGYALAHRLDYRVDSTNLSVEYKRNSIRNEVFPLLERMNPSFIRTMNREMSYFSEADDIVDDWCKANVGDVMTDSGISVSALLSKNHWRYLLYYILEPYGFNSSVLESLEELLVSDRTISGKRFESEEYTLMTERGELQILTKKVQEPAFMPIRGVGKYHVAGHEISIELMEMTEGLSLKQPEGTLILDADRLAFPFIVRQWRQGDWLIPFGMKGRKKVSDMFNDLKFTSLQKEHALMIVDTATEGMAQQHLAGVMGLRIDDGYKVTGKTRRILKITDK